MKDKLLGEIELKLSLQFDRDTREKIMQCVIPCLNDFDVTEKVTDLTVRHEDINERILKRYVASIRIEGKAESSISQYIYTLQKLSEVVGKPYTEMTAYDIRYFLGEIKRRGTKNSYLQSQRSYVLTFFSWMHAEDLIEKNPCDRIKPIKVEQEIRLPFSAVEIDKMRSVCRQPKERAVLELLLSSGIRCDELCNVNVSDIDLDRKTLHVRHGKGAKDRIVFISDVAAEHIRVYLGKRKRNSEALFVSQMTKGRYTDSGIMQMVKQVGARAEVTDVHPHRFRRTFATEMHRRGMEIHMISKLMGHANIATTQRYIYTADDHLHAEYNKYSA